MRYDVESLYSLLPAFHRVRDAAQGSPLQHQVLSGDTLETIAVRYHVRAEDIRSHNVGVLLDPPTPGMTLLVPGPGPLKELIALVAEQVAAIEEDIDQLYDNAFIETCAKWAVPYIGDLIGYQLLHGVAGTQRSSRAEVANTIAFRRRKGTIAMLEQLAHDVTGWDSAAVEFFLRLAVTQYLNHVRLDAGGTADLRDMQRIEWLGTAFDRIPHSVDVRRIASGRGRYNIPNIGLFLWRLQSFRWRLVPAVPASTGDTRRFMFHPLGINIPLLTNPQKEDQISHLAEPANVPVPITRRELQRRLSDFYGADKSFVIWRRSAGPTLIEVPLAEIESCCLADLDPANPDSSAWPQGKAGQVNVDPQLGRIRTSTDEQDLLVAFHLGFSAEMGGGEYTRLSSFAAEYSSFSMYPGAQPTLQAAIEAQQNSGVVEITTFGPFKETPVMSCAAGKDLEIRAADQQRAMLNLEGDLLISGGDSAKVTLNGLLIAGGRIVVPATLNGQPNRLQRLRVVHCTLVPGLSLHRNGEPVSPEAPSIVIECPDTELEIISSILGGVQAVPTANVRGQDSIIDATAPERIAFSAPAPNSDDPGASLSLESCTVIGKVHANIMSLASNSLFFAALASGDTWPAAVIAQRRQQGCVRFSYVPWGSIVPRRYRCSPASAADEVSVAPFFTSRRYGQPGYAQLAANCSTALTQGADDAAEVGAFHSLQQPQRLSDLRARLEEYLRFGLEAGVFCSS